MQPTWYSDIKIHAAPLPRPMAASAVVRVLHGAFRHSPGRYALAMPAHDRPPHSILRVFASTRDDLDKLIDNVRDEQPLKDQATIQYPRSVPDDYSGTWSIYQRFRIPARRSERIPGKSVRLKRINEANARELPFFQIASKSNGGRFRLYWSTQPYPSEPPPEAQLTPDSWGLSTAQNPVPLPDVR